MKELKQLLESCNSHPFLFVGSGFSHRYLDTDDWKGLVSRFATLAQPDMDFPFEFYKNEIRDASLPPDELLPQITELVEKDYNKQFYTNPDFATLRAKSKTMVEQGVSPLKIGVAQHFTDMEGGYNSVKFPQEIEALKACKKNVAGIITTNFDRFLEHIFPDLHGYIGQDELLFNQSYAIGEIYKIHGCSSAPSSLVLNQSDYTTFRRKYAYLSAKLLTIFLEHPIIFIGYSLSDSNIRRILGDIVACLNDPQLEKLSNRLFFIQRKKTGRSEGISTVQESFDGRSITMKQVVAEDFSSVYQVIANLRNSYSPKILRQLKQDVYELVASSTPKERIKVVDIDDATNLDKVEIVIGVGIKKKLLSDLGYERLEFGHLCEDVLVDGDTYDADQIVSKTLPQLGKSTSYKLPMFKYFASAQCPITSDRLKSHVEKVEREGLDAFRSNSIKKMSSKKFSSVREVTARYNLTNTKEASKALIEIVRMDADQIDLADFLAVLQDVTQNHNPVLQSKAPLPSDFRRAVRVYDWLRYGQKKTPGVPSDAEAN